MGHSHNDQGGRGGEQTMVIGRDLVTYNRCTCTCGTDWNDVTNTVRDPAQD